MSKINKRDTAQLDRVVPQLAPETLHQIIRRRGLEACGEIVTSATPEQLTSVLDLDLWRQQRPGQDEQFDVDRFGEWLDVLVETGDSLAARTVAALDKSLVIAGLSRYVRVFDPGIFEPTAQSDDEQIDRHEAMREGDSHASRDRLECEVGGYIVRAQRGDSWDAIVALLLALSTEYPHDFEALMQGCRHISNSRPELDGFHHLLMVPEQHLYYVSVARERRRSRRGYATPADARAFLELARQPTHSRQDPPGAGSANPVVAAYFRAAETASVAAEQTSPPMEWPAESSAWLETPRALLEGAPGHEQRDRLVHVRRLMAYIRDKDEAAYLSRGRELAFLANTLLEGCSVQSRSFTPREASDAAAGICNLGLERWPANPPDSLLVDHDLVAVFETGWAALHRDVSLFVANELIAMLADLHGFDPDLRLGLIALRRSLVRHRDAGAPWRARGAAEILAMLDLTAWIAVRGLLDECPVLSAALMAVLEGRTDAVSATDFEFISTTGQIENVRMFMRRLPQVLA